MKFYGREKEFSKIQVVKERAKLKSQFTMITGGKGVGKTKLVLEATKDEFALYFLVSQKSEALLCDEFEKELLKLTVPVYGKVESFSDLFLVIVEASKQKSFTLIIDEFQDLQKVNPNIFGEIADIWNKNKSQTKLNLIVLGSVIPVMNSIFNDEESSLYGVLHHSIELKPFSPKVIKEILLDYNPLYSSEDLLALYSFTGGVARYVRLLMNAKKTSFKKIISYVLQEDAIFLSEGNNLLVGDFGRDYAVYFSILSAISQGKYSRSEIETYLQREIAGYLTRLEADNGLVVRTQPMFIQSRTKNFRYEMTDSFLVFWFRFIYKNQHLIEQGKFELLKKDLEKGYKQFAELQLKKYLKTELESSSKYKSVGNYWDRKGEKDIDVIAVNELKRLIVFYEVKLDRSEVDLDELKSNVEYFLTQHPEFKYFSKGYKTFSLSDLEPPKSVQSKDVQSKIISKPTVTTGFQGVQKVSVNKGVNPSGLNKSNNENKE